MAFSALTVGVLSVVTQGASTVTVVPASASAIATAPLDLTATKGGVWMDAVVMMSANHHWFVVLIINVLAVSLTSSVKMEKFVLRAFARITRNVALTINVNSAICVARACAFFKTSVPTTLIAPLIFSVNSVNARPSFARTKANALRGFCVLTGFACRAKNVLVT